MMLNFRILKNCFLTILLSLNVVYGFQNQNNSTVNITKAAQESSINDANSIDARVVKEWTKSCVVVQILIQHEIERDIMVEMGLVIDNNGHILVRSDAYPYWIPPQRIQEVRVFPLGYDNDGEGFKAKLVNKDIKLGWNYFQVEERCRSLLKPITEFNLSKPVIGQTLYSLYNMDADFNYQPFLNSALLGTIVNTPFNVGLIMQNSFCLGGPVFTKDGGFIGWVINASPHSYMMALGNNRYPISLIPKNLGNQILFGDSLFQLLNFEPEKINYSARPWLGMVGTIPIDREAAKLMGLEGHGAISISKIIKDGPVDKAGIKERDIVIAVDHVPLIKHASRAVVQNDFHVKVWDRVPGDKITLTVLRDNQKIDIPVVIGAEPKNEREAQYKYFPKLGLTIREFLASDNIEMQNLDLNLKGVRVTFVKPNSPVDTAGLKGGDWLLEVDGESIAGYDQAISILEKLSEHIADRRNAVMLISRDNQTKVLQVKLD